MGFLNRGRRKAKDAQAAAERDVTEGAVDTALTGEPPTAPERSRETLLAELAERGIPCEATILSITETGALQISGKEYEIEVEVSGNGEPYEATLRSYLISAAVAAHQPGAVFEAQAHPDEPTLLSLLAPRA